MPGATMYEYKTKDVSGELFIPDGAGIDTIAKMCASNCYHNNGWHNVNLLPIKFSIKNTITGEQFTELMVMRKGPCFYTEEEESHAKD